MEFNSDVIQLVWHFIPALVMVLIGIAQLSYETGRRRSAAQNLNNYPRHIDAMIRRQ